MMPLARLFTIWFNFSSLTLTVGAVQIAYGNFIQMVVTFLLVAWISFLLLRAVKRMEQHLLGNQAAPATTLPDDTRLLMEIRDLLKARSAAEAIAVEDAPTFLPKS